MRARIGLDAWVYRDGKRSVPAAEALRDVAARAALVESLTGEARRREATSALIASGMVEAALADGGSVGAERPAERGSVGAERPAERGSGLAGSMAAVTDDLAANALGDVRAIAAIAAIDTTRCKSRLVLATPEGFTYYAVDPEAYARAAVRAVAEGPVLVVGVRSIGTTLSAVATAALRARGIQATRITVRPVGSPYDRRLELAIDTRPYGRILVVDEGPGLSGSTLLATAEAVVRAGASRDRVVVVCSFEPEVERLRAPRAAERWRAFRTVVADSRAPVSGLDLSAGAWRHARYSHEDRWPAVFPHGERRKIMAGGRLYKFEGIGPAGDRVRARATTLADAGWGPPVRHEGGGWLSYPWLGQPREDVSLERLAAYCAARPLLCPAEPEHDDLAAMVEKNLGLLGARRCRAWARSAPRKGQARRLDRLLRSLEIVRPAIVDGRMAPHEWVGGIKTDSASDGDGHFFPGPTDIAWDLAGAIVEFRLEGGRRAALLDAYHRASGDDASARIDGWIVAYAACRGGLAALACETARGTAEEHRLARELARHRFVCQQALAGELGMFRMRSMSSIAR